MSEQYLFGSTPMCEAQIQSVCEDGRNGSHLLGNYRLEEPNRKA